LKVPYSFAWEIYGNEKLFTPEILNNSKKLNNFQMTTASSPFGKGIQINSFGGKCKIIFFYFFLFSYFFS